MRRQCQAILCEGLGLHSARVSRIWHCVADVRSLSLESPKESHIVNTPRIRVGVEPVAEGGGHAHDENKK